MILKQMTIPPEAEGQRLGNFLRGALPELPESAIRKAFSGRDVKLDGRRVPAETTVRAGQELRIYLPDTVDPGASQASALEIVYEDEAVLLVNKRAGISVEKDARGGVTLTDLCASYIAGKDPLHAEVRITDREIPGARPITTGYETLESGPVSRLRVHLITGRTHQIRAHLAALGHPVLGDDLYGDRSFNRREKARTLKLCAVSLKLETEGRLPHLDGREFTITPPF